LDDTKVLIKQENGDRAIESYKCPICKKGMKDRASAESHILSVHACTEFNTCDVCGKKVKG
jgi:hypothetical protein